MFPGVGGSTPPRGSAEALEGTYSNVRIRRIGGGCEVEAAAGRDGGVLQIHPPDGLADGSVRERETSDAPPRLEVAHCATDACEQVRRRVTVRRTPGEAWQRREGGAEIVSEPRAARRCRLRTTEWRLAPDSEVIVLRRTIRAETVVLEGGGLCNAATALERRSALPCRRRLEYRTK